MAHEALPRAVVELDARRPGGVDHGRGQEDVGAGGREDRGEAVRLGTGVVGRGLVEDERHERADQPQTVAVQERAQRDRVERQVAERTELGRAQPERGHLAQHPLGREHQTPAGDLAHAP